MPSDLVISAVDGATELQVISAILSDSNNTHSSQIDSTNRNRQVINIGSLSNGEYTLTVSVAGHPELYFRVEIEIRSGEKSIKFRGGRPVCCTVSALQVAQGGTKTRHTQSLNFSLSTNHEEAIFVSGWNYHPNGADYKLYFRTQRDEMYSGVSRYSGRRKRITRRIYDYTVVTLFDFETGIRTRMIKAVSGWHTMDEALQGAVPTFTTQPYNDQANIIQRLRADSISITDVYDYIIALGFFPRGSVKVFHVFSHAYNGGLILVNSYEGQHATLIQRSRFDKDARPKDFELLNMPLRQQFGLAFANDAHVKMWGCRAVWEWWHKIQSAYDNRNSPNTTIDIQIPDRLPDGSPTTRVVRMTPSQVRAEIQQALNSSYMNALAVASGTKVIGAAPGMGANLKSAGRHHYMYVNPSRYNKQFRWLSDEFSITPDEYGYITYG